MLSKALSTSVVSASNVISSFSTSILIVRLHKQKGKREKREEKKREERKKRKERKKEREKKGRNKKEEKKGGKKRGGKKRKKKRKKKEEKKKKTKKRKERKGGKKRRKEKEENKGGKQRRKTKEETKERNKPNVRLRRCTCVHCTGYGASAVCSSSLMSCPFCVRGAAESHGSGKQSPPSPKGVTPGTTRTMLFSSSRCGRAKKVMSTSALPFSHSLGSRRPGVSLPSP